MFPDPRIATDNLAIPVSLTMCCGIKQRREIAVANDLSFLCSGDIKNQCASWIFF
jgi:hypothetical protein